MKKDEFENWMVEKEHKARTTASQYANSIDLISEHYSQQTNKKVDLYDKPDIFLIKKLVSAYGIGGKYKNIGENGNGKKGHGTVRAAIAAYARFLEYKKERNGNPDENIEEPNNENIINSFIDEGNLKHSMVEKLEELFPGYKMFRKQNEKTGLLVLENTSKNELLIIELKVGSADSNVLPSILDYCGSISKEFPNKGIKGVIIAGEIDESLVNACSNPLIDIGVMKYQMKINLEKIV